MKKIFKCNLQLLILFFLAILLNFNGYAQSAGALSFNGSNNFVSLTSSVGNVGAGDFTIQMDINTDNTNEYLFSKRQVCNSPSSILSIGHSANGNVGIEMYGLNLSGNGIYLGLDGKTSINGGWHHLAFTRKSGTVSIFIDGVFDNSGFCDANINNSNIPTLGYSVCTNMNSNVFFKGSMDELRIWNRALCVAEINSNMACELPSGQTGLVNYYKFNQGTVGANNAGTTTLIDGVGNQTGTLNNFGLTGTASNWVVGNASGSCPSFVAPTAAITGSTSLCIGNTTTLANVYTGIWSSSNTAVATIGSTGIVTAVSAGTAVISYTTTDCGGVSTVLVTVNASPTANITASGATSLCTGGSVILTAASASSYLWSTGATTQAITATSAGSYTVMVTNSSGCQSAASAATTVIVNTSPTATITASGATTFCTGGSVTLTAGSASSYLWSTGETTQSITVTTTGNYTVTVTNTNGCTAKSAATTVTVNALPTVSIAAAGVTSICSNSNVALNASTTGTISSYSWLNNGATISGSSNSNAYTASGAGNYSVLVTTSNGCVATSNVVPVTIMASTTPVFNNGNSYLQFGTSANSCDTLATYALSVSGTPTPTVTYTLTGATTGSGSGTGSGLLYSKGVTNVTVTATNTCGANATTNFNVTVSDNVKPVMVTKTATIYLDATGNATVKTTDVDNGSHDNCGAVSLSLQNSGTLCGSATENGVIVLTAPTGALITSVDFASYGTPSGSCGNFALGACNASNSLSIVNGLVLNKNSATITASNGVFGDPCNYTVKNMNVQVKYTGASSSNTFTCSQLGNNTVTLVATDVNGNANSQTVVVNVVDSTRPVVLTQNYTITLDATGNGTVTAANINNGSTDNCGISSMVLNTTSYNYTNVGKNIVTLTVTDNSGNVAFGTAVVTVLANGLSANGQIITNQSTQVDQYGAKGGRKARTAFGQIFGSSNIITGGTLPLSYTAYVGSGATPVIPSTGAILSTGTITQLNYSWNNLNILNSGYKSLVQIHFTGSIVWPGINGLSKTVKLYDQSDDGFTMSINKVSLISNWIDQGNSGGSNYNGSGSITLTAGVTYPIDIWYYQNQGGASCTLLWDIGDGNGIVVVPATSL